MESSLHLVTAPFLHLHKVSRHFALPGSFWRRQHTTLFEGLSLRIGGHETLGLVGASGCGKSSLLKILLALEAPDNGEVYCTGEKIRPGSLRSLREYRQRVQYIAQDPAGSLPPAMTVGQIIAEPLKHLGFTDDIRLRVSEVMAQVSLSGTLICRTAGELSGGQAQRVAIARALAIRPQFLVADEPVSGLDLPLRAQVKQLLHQVTQQNGMGLLMVTHDISMVAGLCDRVLVMYGGKIVEDRATQDVLRAPDHTHTRQLLQAVPHLPLTVNG
ncbi:dipeptide/oligopeptide/nickel ABC transporter ATP-binding protein [Rahnella bruchi]|uniref:ABC transporter ATP-binding protein n=1 Tax=Rahnella bruchi TaxID=1510573 RepID=UPI000EA1A4BC|nr:dipeptide/oligopeptide/nickel ABC transporter ATP-binding protein [Rahnella bruchi]